MILKASRIRTLQEWFLWMGTAITISIFGIVIGWIVCSTTLVAVVPVVLPMHPVTALIFFVATAALWLCGNTSRRKRNAGIIFSVAVVLAGLVQLCGYLIRSGSTIDHLLLREQIYATGAQLSRDIVAMPAVVLLDLKLPRIDGLEVLRRMRADPRLHTLPVVILTSSREEEDLMQGYNFGANSYIRKPVDFAKFVEAVRNLAFYWLVLNESPPIENAAQEK